MPAVLGGREALSGALEVGRRPTLLDQSLIAVAATFGIAITGSTATAAAFATDAAGATGLSGFGQLHRTLRRTGEARWPGRLERHGPD